MISLDDMRPAWRRPTGAQQRRLPLRHKRLAKIIDLAKNLDDPTSSPPSLSDGRLPQKAFQAQSLSRAKTPYPGYISSYFKLRHRRSTKTLSMQRPLPSMLIRTPAASSTPVNGKLGTLVAVEDLRSAVKGQGFFEGLDAEDRVHRIRQPPTQHFPAVPVHDRHQVEKSPWHRDVRDLPLRVAQGPGRPHLVGPIDGEAAQQVRIDLVLGVRLAGVGLLPDHL